MVVIYKCGNWIGTICPNIAPIVTSSLLSSLKEGDVLEVYSEEGPWDPSSPMPGCMVTTYYHNGSEISNYQRRIPGDCDSEEETLTPQVSVGRRAPLLVSLVAEQV